MLLPYNYYFSLKGCYTFVTSRGIVYNCYFVERIKLEAFASIEVHVLEFILEKEDDSAIAPKDNLVGLTVATMLAKFFVKNPDTAVFVQCDMSDQREILRHRRFEEWFLKYNSFGLAKFNKHIQMQDFNLFFSIIVRENHPKIDQVKFAFEKSVIVI